MVNVTYILFAAIFNIHVAKMREVDGMATQAAIQRVRTAHGNQVTLSCDHMTKDRAPLRYCQFEPPAGKPFNIDSDVTPEKAILERYYFPSNMSLSRGDCAVLIHKVQQEDEGRWTCGAGLNDGKEHLGIIALQLKGLYNVHEESHFAFAAIGGGAFLVIIVGFFIKQRLSVRTASVNDGQTRPTPIPIIIIQPPTPTRSDTS